MGRGQLKCDGTRAETRFSLSVKRTSPFKSAGASVQCTTSSRDVRISDSNAACTMFRGNVNGPGYPLHSPVSPSLPSPCVTVCHHIATRFYPELFLLGVFSRRVEPTTLLHVVPRLRINGLYTFPPTIYLYDVRRDNSLPCVLI